MNWYILFSRYTILAVSSVGVVLLTASVNVWLWASALFALLIAVMFLFDRQKSYPVLVWAIGYNWLGIAAGILSADLVGMNLAEADLGPFRVQAVNLNLMALVAYAAGIAAAARFGAAPAIIAKAQAAAKFEHAVTIQTGVIAYFASLALAEFAGFIVSNIPQLQQPIIVLYLLKFICIYLVAVSVFLQGRGYGWLIVLLSFEVVSGLTSFFGTFKEAFFLVLIALLAVGRRPSIRMWGFGVASAVLVLVLSLMWTAVKPDYRRWVSGYTGEQIIVRTFDERLGWMADRLFQEKIDYWKSLQDMVARIDSTTIFARYLEKDDLGDVADLPSRFGAGLEHVLMPRILFPDKAALDDSEITSAMTGIYITKNTSISIGYVAEAYHDFGRWWMFAPIFLIGIAVGLVGRYFMTRSAPFLICQAFATTALFNFFQFGTNFNKALGTFLVGFMVLALVLKFGYPLIARWLSGEGPERARLADLPGAE